MNLIVYLYLYCAVIWLYTDDIFRLWFKAFDWANLISKKMFHQTHTRGNIIIKLEGTNEDELRVFVQLFSS